MGFITLEEGVRPRLTKIFGDIAEAPRPSDSDLCSLHGSHARCLRFRGLATCR